MWWRRRADFLDIRSSAATLALGAAMDIYNAPLAQPGAPPEPGVYATASGSLQGGQSRVCGHSHDYGWLPEGAKAHYFAGITYEEMGQNGLCRDRFEGCVRSLGPQSCQSGQVALAGLYHQTTATAQAIDLYNALVAKPSETVSAGVAQLDLADLYAAEGKQDQARALWAKVKDADKDGAAGQIAAQKLAAK